METAGSSCLELLCELVCWTPALRSGGCDRLPLQIPTSASRVRQLAFSQASRFEETFMGFNFPKMQTLTSFRFLLALLFATTLVSGQTGGGAALLLRKPTVSRTQIAFSYGGDLWTVDRNGGEARRITTDVGIEIDPYFSPDGSLIAFTGEYEGNEDVYVIPAAGGIPRRLTSHPGADQVVGWTRDGRILFRSQRNS